MIDDIMMKEPSQIALSVFHTGFSCNPRSSTMLEKTSRTLEVRTKEHNRDSGWTRTTVTNNILYDILQDSIEVME